MKLRPPRRPRWRAPVAGLVAAGLLAAAGCGSDDPVAAAAADTGRDGIPASSEPVTITFLSYNYGTPGIGGEGTQALLDAFAKAHPTITVEPQAVAVADVLTTLRTETAAGSPPDVAQIGYSKMAEALQALPITPLREIPSQAEWDAHVEGISPSILAATSFDGAQPAMPFTLSIPIMYINADLFRQAGLDPERPPTTIEAVKQAGLAIAATGAQGAYIAAADTGKSDYLTQSLVNSNGGSLVDENGEITLDSPEAVEALAAVQDLTVSGAQPAVDVKSAIAAFTGGDLGILLASSAALASVMGAADGQFELRTSGFPAFGSKPPTPTYSGAGLAVLADDDAHKRAAWEFVSFMTSDEAFRIITEKIGYLPLRPAIAEELADTPIGQLLAPSIGQIDTVAPYTSFPGERANEAVVVLQDEAVEPIVLRDADPAETLAAAAEKIRGLTG